MDQYENTEGMGTPRLFGFSDGSAIPLEDIEKILPPEEEYPDGYGQDSGRYRVFVKDCGSIIMIDSNECRRLQKVLEVAGILVS